MSIILNQWPIKIPYSAKSLYFYKLLTSRIYHRESKKISDPV